MKKWTVLSLIVLVAMVLAACGPDRRPDPGAGAATRCDHCPGRTRRPLQPTPRRRLKHRPHEPAAQKHRPRRAPAATEHRLPGSPAAAASPLARVRKQPRAKA